MRLFIAVPVPPLPGILGLMAELKEKLPRVRWVPPENLHITVKFLGEVGEASARRVESALERAAEGAAFQVEPAGLGTFASPGGERTLWAGCGEGREALTTLAARVEEALEALPFPKEKRPFAPHLTLARFSGGGVVRPADFAGRSFGRFRAEKIVLMRSELSGGPPVYTARRAFALARI